jgi:hypothetical protein
MPSNPPTHMPTNPPTRAPTENIIPGVAFPQFGVGFSSGALGGYDGYAADNGSSELIVPPVFEFGASAKPLTNPPTDTPTNLPTSILSSPPTSTPTYPPSGISGFDFGFMQNTTGVQVLVFIGLGFYVPPTVVAAPPANAGPGACILKADGKSCFADSQCCSGVCSVTPFSTRVCAS